LDTNCRCHSCGVDVHADTRRCPSCYVALGEASRAPSPLRAAPTATAPGGQLAFAAATLVVEPPASVGVRCPACETTVMPLTGWCSYCMEPLPIAVNVLDSAAAAVFTGDWAGEAGGEVIAGPWPGRERGHMIRPAGWRHRALAALVDAAVFLPAGAAVAFSLPVALVLLTAAVALTVWQFCSLQPRTGQTIGKNRVGIFVAPIGVTPLGVRGDRGDRRQRRQVHYSR
jgi:hypothetical protein